MKRTSRNRDISQRAKKGRTLNRGSHGAGLLTDDWESPLATEGGALKEVTPGLRADLKQGCRARRGDEGALGNESEEFRRLRVGTAFSQRQPEFASHP